jgi:hypothetical protein
MDSWSSVYLVKPRDNFTVSSRIQVQSFTRGVALLTWLQWRSCLMWGLYFGTYQHFGGLYCLQLQNWIGAATDSLPLPSGSDNVCALTVRKLLPREPRQVIQRHASLLFRDGCLGERRPRFVSSFASERDRSQMSQALISMKETKATKDCRRSLPANTLCVSDLPLPCS